MIAKVWELCRNYLNGNHLIWPIIKLYCFHHYHIVICHNIMLQNEEVCGYTIYFSSEASGVNQIIHRSRRLW